MNLALQLRRAEAWLQTKTSPKITDHELARLLLKYFEPHDAVVMFAIAGAESGYKTMAKNVDKRHGQADYGLYQINEIHKPDLARVYEPEYNIAQAHRIWKRQGFTAWVAYDRNKHEPFLERAVAAIASAQSP